jgi:hypothetical protein
MKLSLAFVNFFREARGKRVVKIQDVVNFDPKHHGDFDEDKTYSVKWAHLPNELSFSTEGTYDAKIICLGGKDAARICVGWLFYSQVKVMS